MAAFLSSLSRCSRLDLPAATQTRVPRARKAPECSGVGSVRKASEPEVGEDVSEMPRLGHNRRHKRRPLRGTFLRGGDQRNGISGFE